MIRRDKLTVERESFELVFGEKVYLPPKIMAKDVPCHLSVTLNNTCKLNGAPYNFADFTLFTDTRLKLDIKENDTLIIDTDKNQHYRLYAGEIKVYGITTQIKCRQEKVIEENDN